MSIFARKRKPRRNLFRLYGEDRGMAGETAGRKDVVKGDAARIWSRGRSG